jgi:hypothetical protein
MRREGASAAEISKAVEVAADSVAASRQAMSPKMRGVLSVFLDEEATGDAQWLESAGIGAESAEGRPASYDHAPVFGDPVDEQLIGGIQLIWDEVVRIGEEQATEGAYRIASAMLARGEIAEEDLGALLDWAVDEKYEDHPWSEWLGRARQRVERERGWEAG